MLQNDAPGGAISSQIFEGLYKYDEKLKPQPWLAETIDISESGLEYVFHLRKDVKFHDGSEMDAEAVKFSVDRVRNNSKSVGYADGRTINTPR
jgi:ABC-type transport system substrate-binding protein